MCDNARECAAAKDQGFVGPGANPLRALDASTHSPLPLIRPARDSDLRAVLDVHRAAFDTDAESRLVDALVADGDAVVSLVALQNAVLVGHVLLSRVRIDGAEWLRALSLAPIAVRPEAQRKGVGSALVEAALQSAREQGWDAVIVLGHPEFYPRFGFVEAIPQGILPPWPEVPSAAWMIADLSGSVIGKVSGVVEFPPPFDEVV